MLATLTDGLLADRYQLDPDDILGEGTNSGIWRARDIFTGKEVAIKRLLDFAGEDPTDHEYRIKRLQYEGRILSQLDHPNIVGLIDIGNDPAFLVLDLIEGGRVMVDPRLWDVSRVVRLAIDVCQALAVIHDTDIVHRDIKPANLLLDTTGRTIVIDFSISRSIWAVQSDVDLSKTGKVKGSPCHLSPEQARGIGVTGFSDIFSLGIVLHELLTGTSPFRVYPDSDSTHQAKSAASIVNDPPCLLDLRDGAALAPLLIDMLSKNPLARPSAIEVEEQRLHSLDLAQAA